MTTLANTGTCTYWGVRFNVYRSRISGKPEYDRAKRTVKWVTYTLMLEGVLVVPEMVTHPDGTTDITAGTDGTMENMRIRLQTPGGALTFEDKGFGSLCVNTLTSSGVSIHAGKAMWDAAWGPFPVLLDW